MAPLSMKNPPTMVKRIALSNALRTDSNTARSSSTAFMDSRIHVILCLV